MLSDKEKTEKEIMLMEFERMKHEIEQSRRLEEAFIKEVEERRRREDELKLELQEKQEIILNQQAEIVFNCESEENSEGSERSKERCT